MGGSTENSAYGVTKNPYDNAKYKATERYSFGWSDARACYGSAGA
jgi:Asp-tRNA(Asn)/Glu-tRNA(Gln) amidotransferase A subunit family amidase